MVTRKRIRKKRQEIRRLIEKISKSDHYHGMNIDGISTEGKY